MPVLVAPGGCKVDDGDIPPGVGMTFSRSGIPGSSLEVLSNCGLVIRLARSIGQRHQLIEPSVGDDDVVVEQHEVFAAAYCSPWLMAAGNPRFVALVMTVTGTGEAS